DVYKRQAYDRGIRFFDVADLYGTHTFLRDAIKGIPREDIVIQSKIWFRKEGLPEQVTDAMEAVERFRRELGTDYIDIVLLHCTTDGGWLDQLKRMREQLSEAKEKGIIKAHGTSSHSIDALKASLASDWVDVQLARINHAGSHMDGKPDEVAELLRKMRSANKGVIGMKIFGEGTFRAKEQRWASLHFVLTQRCVDTFIIGFERPSEIDETIKMVEEILVSL
ncbi:MAG: aldo/keto reductase, partial [Armatimonadetes bacterium]|nr:aldo/keto reductase [Armatimonadota bacterium]